MNSLIIPSSGKGRTTQIVCNEASIPVSVFAHELRNPLTNIMLTVRLLESKILDDNDRMYIDIIKRSTSKMNGLINDLINDLVKGEQKKEIPTETHSVHQLLDEVIELSSDRLVLKNVVVKKNYAPYDLKVKIARPKVKIALTNIIINAIDAMPSENGELRLGTKLIGGSYAITIQDNGCGISKENLPLIFNPFFTNKPGGMGVGLAATKEILLSNRIGIKVESIVGMGTSFMLLFEKNKVFAGRRELLIRHTSGQNRSLAPVTCMA